jgi:hypothetical protein
MVRIDVKPVLLWDECHRHGVLLVYLYHAGVTVIRKLVRINLNLVFSFASHVFCK